MWTHLPPAPDTPRSTWVLLLDALDAWPKELPFASPTYATLVVSDGRDTDPEAPEGASLETWLTFAHRSTHQGLDYFCTWGPACEAMHDTMDLALAVLDVDARAAPQFVMTTWHKKEALREALRWLRSCATQTHSSGLSLLRGPTTPCVIALVRRPDLVPAVQEAHMAPRPQD